MSDAGAPGAAVVDAAAVARQEQLAKDLAHSKEAGWHDQQPFQDETGVVVGTPQGEETGDGDSAPWMSEAAVYEWDDDFGDVGERNPALEQQLYNLSGDPPAGSSIHALSFDVNVEGTKVSPIRNVSLHCSDTHDTISR